MNYNFQITDFHRDKPENIPPAKSLMKEKFYEGLRNYNAQFAGFSDVTDEASLRAFAEKDLSPIPPPHLRENYYHLNHLDYWMSGALDFLNVCEVLKRENIPYQKGLKVFELGCASGRVLRHFQHQLEDPVVWGADIKASSIQWAKDFLPKSVKVFQGSTLPHLPLEDNSFDLVTAFSVFTHINQFEQEWVLELRRILRPGGCLYLTVMGTDCWSKIKKYPDLHRHLLGYPNFKKYETQTSLPEPKLVLDLENAGPYTATVFHSREYVEGNWFRFFSKHYYLRELHGTQDVVCMVK